MGGYVVSGNYFQTLGGGIALGRPILPEDECLGPACCCIEPCQMARNIQWRRRDRGQNDRAVGQSLCSGRSGIDSSFTGLDPLLPDFWAPLSAKRLFAGSGRVSNEADERSLRIIGRLRPGVTEAEAQSGMSVLIPEISQSRQRELQLEDAQV